MTNYYRITGYYPKKDFCFILDSNGMFEKMWQFSSFLIQKGIKVIEVSNEDTFLDYNIQKVENDTNHVILRASSSGKPEEITQTIDGITYKAIKVGDKIYIPKKENIIQ